MHDVNRFTAPRDRAERRAAPVLFARAAERRNENARETKRAEHAEIVLAKEVV